MDLVLGLPKTKAGNDTLWVIVDILTKCVLLIHIHVKWSMVQLTKFYIKYVVRYHEVPRNIVSGRYTRCLS